MRGCCSERMKGARGLIPHNADRLLERKGGVVGAHGTGNSCGEANDLYLDGTRYNPHIHVLVWCHGTVEKGVRHLVWFRLFCSGLVLFVSFRASFGYLCHKCVLRLRR